METTSPKAKSGKKKKRQRPNKVKGRPPRKLPVLALMEKTMTLRSNSIDSSIPLTITLPESKLLKPDPLELPSIGDTEGEATQRSSNFGSARSFQRLNCDFSVGSSQWDASVLSEMSGSTRAPSMKDLITEIERRNALHQPIPDYVTPLSELSPALLSWNKQVPTNSEDPSRDPPVNIIGCMHPVQLILARADRRIRKQQRAQEQKAIQCEKKIQEINEVIEWKATRAERYAKQLAMQQLQVQWLRNLVLTRYLHELRDQYLRFRASHLTWKKILRSASIISKYYYKWYRRHQLSKLSSRVSGAFIQAKNVFRFYLRIYRKRKATTKIRTFLNEYRNHHKMNVVVHRYLMSVRKVQSCIRSFLQCKAAKIEALTSIWDKLEYNYIKKKLEQKKERMKNNNTLLSKKSSKNLKDAAGQKKSHGMNGKATSPTLSPGGSGGMTSPGGGGKQGSQATVATSFEDDDDASVQSFSLDLLESKEHSKMLLEMKYQAKSWQRIDGKMESMIAMLRHTGVIQAEKEADTIAKLVAPKALKIKLLKVVVELVRREFYLGQRAIIREKIKMDATFSERHAQDLLRGNTENIERIVNNKFGQKIVQLKFQPLYFFKRLDRKLVHDKIKEAHNSLKTFHIAIDTHL